MFGDPAGKLARLKLPEAPISRLQRHVRALALTVLAAAVLAVAAAAPARAETRTLKLYNTHTHERVEITFKKNGRYLSSGLRELNRFLRDWRRNEITKMDPELFDLVWEVYQKAGTNKPIHVVSGYRSPATNNMLRRRSSGVAKSSMHTRGRAMDFYIPGVNASELRALGLRKEVGGVGYYPSSRTPFVHLDTGRVRHWPRMTRRQLAKVFPRGDTIHVPSDGKKMPRYAEALARQKSGGSRPATTQVASAPSASSLPRRNSTDLGDTGRRIATPPTAASAGSSDGPGLIARIFTGGDDDAAASAPTPPAPVRSEPARATATAQTPPPVPPAAPEPVAEEPASEPEQDPIVVARVVPPSKPAGFAAIVARATDGAVAPGTLDDQARRLAEGQPAVPVPPAPVGEAPVVVAAAPPAQKPQELQTKLALAAADAVPRAAPNDGVSAIAAATGAGQPLRKPQELTAATLAYAPAVTASVAGPADTVAVPKRRAAAPASAPSSSASGASVAGSLPPAVLDDPLARFAALPDRSNPDLISGRVTTRTRRFATLSHPNQRQLEFLLTPRGRVFANRFADDMAGAPRADRFEGAAVVLLPVVALR